MDEPTSGLDSAGALAVCHALRDIAAAGLTVVAVLHQPRREIMALVDDLVLMQARGTFD